MIREWILTALDRRRHRPDCITCRLIPSIVFDSRHATAVTQARKMLRDELNDLYGDFEYEDGKLSEILKVLDRV